MLLLLLGNGLQGTLLGIRGAIEGYDAATMSLVMSAYYVGFLIGSRRATSMIARVGHVRVFAALGSMISAAFILYAAAPNPWVWSALRLVVGFSFAGVYVVAESWLNEAATNETRGQALSLYMIVQMLGIISAQFVLNLADPAGYLLFVVMSVLVSISFLPILLTAGTAPAFKTTKPMTLVQLFRISPLGCVGTFLLGGVYAGIFGMGSVFGTQKGLNVAEISAFVAAIYVGGLVFQYPIGWVSDRMDRRVLIMGLTVVGALLTPRRRAGLGRLRGGADARLHHRRRRQPALFADHRLYQRLPGAVGHGGGLGRAALHQRARGDDRAVGDRRGDDPVRGQRLLRLHRNAVRADRVLCALPLDQAGGAGGGRDLLLCAGAADGLAGGAGGGAGGGDRAGGEATAGRG